MVDNMPNMVTQDPDWKMFCSLRDKIALSM